MAALELSLDQIELLKAIESAPETPLGGLPLGWDLTRITSLARDLQRQRILLLSPGISPTT